MTEQEIIERIANFLWGTEGENWHIASGSGDIIAHVMPFDMKSETYSFEADFDPLTNANHWMMVVEKMRELGYHFMCSNDEELWIARFEIWQNRIEWERHDNLGHAVCLAALKTMEAK